MICIIDYGLGNVGSIGNMLKRIGVEVIISSDLEVIDLADKIIIPGVGAFDEGMKLLSSCGLDVFLRIQAFEKNKPILGICLGMQLMTRGSEEGECPGLGWIAADTIHFNRQILENGHRIPHMGWNHVKATQWPEAFPVLEDDSRFYFVHSYHVVCDDDSDTLTQTTHGNEFTSGFRRDNVIGI
ncbi:imidazole glycerol phosphate synthase subunit HisH [bacterium F16]|nr:imidazole glycerol phosphate synthase subunit HisH [bacterium F16]